MNRGDGCMTSMLVPLLKRRDPEGHKGNFGRALIVGGSRGMAGAVSLSGISALRAGAGLVTLAVPDRCLETVAAHSMCYMTVPLPDDRHGRLAEAAISPIRESAERSTSIGIGPGMGRSESVTTVVSEIYRSYPGPMLVDADGLNALASLPELPKPGGPRVLTPHIGEFQRLVKDVAMDSPACRQRAPRLAADAQAVVVVKGRNTLVTDGIDRFENNTGNPGMATAGAGDVLAGVITALLGQQYSPMEAAILGVHVHGLAGDLARDREFGETSLTADGISLYLKEAFRALESG